MQQGYKPGYVHRHKWLCVCHLSQARHCCHALAVYPPAVRASNP